MKRKDIDELNFTRFEKIYPVYRDMGGKCKEAFREANEMDMFHTDEVLEQAEEIKRLNKCFESAQYLWEHLKPQLKDMEDVGLTKNELNKISLILSVLVR